MEKEYDTVKCPFYKDETKNTIRCEGIFTNAISNNFEYSGQKRKHRDAYCCKKYRDCTLYRVVTSKYF